MEASAYAQVQAEKIAQDFLPSFYREGGDSDPALGQGTNL